jgi:hypothetical protein
MLPQVVGEIAGRPVGLAGHQPADAPLLASLHFHDVSDGMNGVDVVRVYGTMSQVSAPANTASNSTNNLA